VVQVTETVKVYRTWWGSFGTGRNGRTPLKRVLGSRYNRI
jgi:hypothetical protein